ncbi:MAG: SH3 domain-containing C40 family peptidase [Lachnospiraceae bacterium]|nr:SH3 domain-containing C40 family peptidase [Lachnospiraceae bacterium]
MKRKEKMYFCLAGGLTVAMLYASPVTVSAAGENSIQAIAPSAGVTTLLQNKLSEDEYLEAAKNAEGSYWGYTNLGVSNTEDNNLNIRETPATDGKLVGKLPRHAGCEVIKKEGDWYYVKSGKVEGYVSADYLLTGVGAVMKAKSISAVMATVTTDSLKVREEPSLDAEVVTMVANGEELEVIEEDGDWVKVYLDSDEVYVSAEFVDVDERLDEAVTMTELLYGAGVSDIRVTICQYAKEFLGNPYVWGGTSLTNGADCSGYVQSVFKNYGVKLPRTSRDQANAGTTISASQLQPGDLVFYGKRSYIDHVGIYIGGGQIINASNPRSGICIKGINYRSPIKYVRILQD